MTAPLTLPDVALLERLDFDFDAPCEGRDCDQPAVWWVRFTRCRCGCDVILICAVHYARMRPVLAARTAWQCTICGAGCRVQAIGRLR